MFGNQSINPFTLLPNDRSVMLVLMPENSHKMTTSAFRVTTIPSQFMSLLLSRYAVVCYAGLYVSSIVYCMRVCVLCLCYCALCLLFHSPLRYDAYHYWWRATSVSFLLRPNAATRRHISSLEPRYARGTRGDGCVAAFVRHGDKGSEMKLRPFPEYTSAVMSLYPLLAPVKVTPRLLFISTDDPLVGSHSLYS